MKYFTFAHFKSYIFFALLQSKTSIWSTTLGVVDFNKITRSRIKGRACRWIFLKTDHDMSTWSSLPQLDAVSWTQLMSWTYNWCTEDNWCSELNWCPAHIWCPEHNWCPEHTTNVLNIQLMYWTYNWCPEHTTDVLNIQLMSWT